MKTDKIQPSLTKNGKSLTAALDPQQLLLFNHCQKAILEIFPLENGKFQEMSLEVSENFAFNMVKGIVEYVESQ